MFAGQWKNGVVLWQRREDGQYVSVRAERGGWQGERLAQVAKLP